MASAAVVDPGLLDRIAKLEEVVNSQGDELIALRQAHEELRATVQRSAASASSGRPSLAAAAAAGAVDERNKSSQVGRSSQVGGQQSRASISASSLGGGQRGSARQALSDRSQDYSRGLQSPDSKGSSMEGIDLFELAKPILTKKGKDPKLVDRTLQDLEDALTQGASVDRWSGPGTPLTGAVYCRSLDFVELLLQANASANSRDDKGVSALHTASFDGNDLICKALLAANADVNVTDEHRQTPLFFAPTRAVCECLSRAHADINAMNSLGQSALHLAAKAGLGDTLLWLSQRQSRAVLNLKDYQGQSAEDYARASGCRMEVVQQLKYVAGGDRHAPAKTQTIRRKEIAPGEDSGPPTALGRSGAAVSSDVGLVDTNFAQHTTARSLQREEETQQLRRASQLQARAAVQRNDMIF
eukprot:CAMPEP_0206469434 /NCGR_PEP_ID=MMETSP0324_2-20121206/30277_1 /ASSEMBLY_ACC=CAM_ASM_000836 /TAXON_ID=2866 /ORGANISM="Crypthecodinium cohnii, Strain Seligo" /LENGTH=414 /DNA_ID=CAMNT_0053943191 /DNA_START=156 /DNA_END=1401 /DNA_ORIENTATION=+